jgi:hypothetical protein
MVAIDKTKSAESKPKTAVDRLIEAGENMSRASEPQSQPHPPEKSSAPKVITPDMFYNPFMPTLDEQIVIETARAHGIEPEALMAFAQIESPKGPYMSDGRPYILYEAHVFARNCAPKGKYNDQYPTLSSASWDASLYGAGGTHQYDRLERALRLDQHAALCACSWGSYQILGENWEYLGFSSPEEMILYMIRSEANQFDVFMRFIKKKGIIHALRAKDWDTAFYKYNGSAYKKHGYDTRFLSIYRDLTSHTLRRGASGIKVVRLQKLLNKFDFALKVDGVLGPSTEEAVKDMQQRWGIKVDGIVGAETYERLASERVDDTSMLGSKRNIGAGGAAIGGGAAVVEGINSINKTAEVEKAKNILDQLKDVQVTTETANKVVVSAKDATEKVIQVQQQSSDALIVFGLFIIAVAGYIIWTKWFDTKKAEGVK